jgi:hypothetical protein
MQAGPRYRCIERRTGRDMEAAGLRLNAPLPDLMRFMPAPNAGGAR